MQFWLILGKAENHRGLSAQEGLPPPFYLGVAQLVGRLLWEQEIGGSNPSTQTRAERPMFPSAGRVFGCWKSLRPSLNWEQAGGIFHCFNIKSLHHGHSRGDMVESTCKEVPTAQKYQ